MKKSSSNLLKYFDNINVDISDYTVDNLYNGAHIARYIRRYALPHYRLKLTTHRSSGVHALTYKDHTLLVMINDEANYQLENPYYKGNLIIDIPQLNVNLFYFKETLKNLFFFEHLAYNSINYEKYKDIFKDNEKLFKTFIASNEDPYNHDSGFDCTFNNDNMIITHNRFNYEIILKLDTERGMRCSLKLNNNIVIETFNFDKFIKNTFKTLYEEKIQHLINIPANEFSKEYRKIVEVFLF